MRLSFILKFFVFLLIFGFSKCGIAQEEEPKEGFKEEQLTFSNGDSRYASYNKEGTKIIFESNRDGIWQIYVMNIDGSAQKRVMTTNYNDRRPKWHPSKNMILFESDRTGTSEIYSYDFDSGKVDQFPINLSGNKYYANFAPNGMELMFSYSERADIFDIYACSTKGKRLKKVVSNKFKNVYPNLTSRGDVLIYFSNKNTQGESNIIYSQHLFTKDKNRLTYLKDESTYPDWSNTNGSRRIVYSAKVDDMKHSEIFIMRDDGTHKIQITYNDVEDMQPCWSPNDINLLISGFRQGNYQICKILLKEPLNPDQKPLD
ncbi:TolB family protein [Aestuariibaculum suncheonense]|uniref:PD40 domain-containing protein n=1 Tax=Aestuariibaculum suncheonense TaxID=1028745 RepID=A0A8J6QRR6_9FLAO|nr:PD40 domain-containing protein [Aestuariibaculum suncheonense]MBD0834894.1 PD40 domain-containing protein [Aestuariibaculum suncheonense]